VNREPIFNIPPVVLAVLAVLALVHLVRTLLLTEQQDIEFLLTFAFIPARYDNSVVLGGTLPGGGADIWTFVTYALIHADWLTLALMRFGSCHLEARSRAASARCAFLPFWPSLRRLVLDCISPRILANSTR